MLSIDKGYRFDTFKRTAFYNGQSEDRFFWLHDLCLINGIKGKFKVGLWFQKGIIRQIQLLYMADNVANETARSAIHNAIIKDKILKLNASNISNYWDKRDQYSTIVIDFDEVLEVK